MSRSTRRGSRVKRIPSLSCLTIFVVVADSLSNLHVLQKGESMNIKGVGKFIKRFTITVTSTVAGTTIGIYTANHDMFNLGDPESRIIAGSAAGAATYVVVSSVLTNTVTTIEKGAQKLSSMSKKKAVKKGN